MPNLKEERNTENAGEVHLKEVILVNFKIVVEQWNFWNNFESERIMYES